MKIRIKPASLEEVLSINSQIPEFDEPNTSLELKHRCKENKCLMIAAFVDEKPAGYLVGYELDHKTFYCWMTGVIPEFRKNGILSKMMEHQSRWAKKNGYTKLRIKTRNTRREMMHYLINHGFNFTDVEKMNKVEYNRILLEKSLK
ncbi:MAG: GNAT family N-acetyltransferase [Candidatus Aenigmarchaeota archaeon]|nr:GNAT family N-acetyltransferase [Candidatus Aenigmarchaeota archaeon]